jgi:hypothetical protein
MTRHRDGCGRDQRCEKHSTTPHGTSSSRLRLIVSRLPAGGDLLCQPIPSAASAPAFTARRNRRCAFYFAAPPAEPEPAAEPELEAEPALPLAEPAPLLSPPGDVQSRPVTLSLPCTQFALTPEGFFVLFDLDEGIAGVAGVAGVAEVTVPSLLRVAGVAGVAGMAGVAAFGLRVVSFAAIVVELLLPSVLPVLVELLPGLSIEEFAPGAPLGLVGVLVVALEFAGALDFWRSPIASAFALPRAKMEIKNTGASLRIWVSFSIG